MVQRRCSGADRPWGGRESQTQGPRDSPLEPRQAGVCFCRKRLNSCGNNVRRLFSHTHLWGSDQGSVLSQLYPPTVDRGRPCRSSSRCFRLKAQRPENLKSSAVVTSVGGLALNSTVSFSSVKVTGQGRSHGEGHCVQVDSHHRDCVVCTMPSCPQLPSPGLGGEKGSHPRSQSHLPRHLQVRQPRLSFWNPKRQLSLHWSSGHFLQRQMSQPCLFFLGNDNLVRGQEHPQVWSDAPALTPRVGDARSLLSGRT